MGLAATEFKNRIQVTTDLAEIWPRSWIYVQAILDDLNNTRQIAITREETLSQLKLALKRRIIPGQKLEADASEAVHIHLIRQQIDCPLVELFWCLVPSSTSNWIAMVITHELRTTKICNLHGSR